MVIETNSETNKKLALGSIPINWYDSSLIAVELAACIIETCDLPLLHLIICVDSQKGINALEFHLVKTKGFRSNMDSAP